MSERKKELIIEFEYIEKQIQVTSQKLDELDKQALQLSASLAAIEKLQIKDEHEAYVPIADGVYVSATVKETKTYLVDMGADVGVKKTASEAIDMFEVQLAATNEFQEKVVERMESLSKRADELQKELIALSKGN